MVNNYTNMSPIDSGFMSAKLINDNTLSAVDGMSFPELNIENGKMSNGEKQFARVDPSPGKGDQIKTAWQKTFNDAQAMRKARYRQ